MFYLPSCFLMSSGTPAPSTLSAFFLCFWAYPPETPCLMWPCFVWQFWVIPLGKVTRYADFPKVAIIRNTLPSFPRRGLLLVELALLSQNQGWYLSESCTLTPLQIVGCWVIHLICFNWCSKPANLCFSRPQCCSPWLLHCLRSDQPASCATIWALVEVGLFEI